MAAPRRRAFAQTVMMLTASTLERHGAATAIRDASGSVVREPAARRLHYDIRILRACEWYGPHGCSLARGYLLYAPGTGKTSVAYALAGELHLKLCAMSLSNAKLTDAMLANQLQSTPPRSLILIEDIDGFFNAREKQDTRITISFSGLLNALDGVGAQEGRIIVLTTNHRERLDPALIRPGRIDVDIELGNADASNCRACSCAFSPEAQAHCRAAGRRLRRRRSVTRADSEDPDRRRNGRRGRGALARHLHRRVVKAIRT